jgi:hypothetical protein
MNGGGLLALTLGSVVFLGAGCAEMPFEEGRLPSVSVTAEGWAPIDGVRGLLTARYRALAEAQKKAVEKAVGVTLKASTRVDDAVSIRQSIVANMGGTIRRYEVLSEGPQDGFFKIKIRADVLYRPPSIPLAGVKAARFYVRIPDEKIADAVRDSLAVADFRLTENERDADVLVTGVVETYGLADPRLGGLFSCRAKVSLKAADVRTGRVSDGTYEDTAMDLDERIANESAREKVGKNTGLALAAMFTDTATINASLFP